MANTLKFGNGEWYGKKDTILAYNDLNSNYKPLPFNFSRASKATVVNKDGLIEEVGSGQPRIDYKDDSKGALLLEPSRSNNLLQSNQFDTTWLKSSGVTITSEQTISPEGINNGWKFEKTAASYKSIGQNYTSSSETTFSIFAKKGTLSVITLLANINSGTNLYQRFDLENGIVSTGSGMSSSNIEEYGNGWYRCSSTFTNTNVQRLDCFLDFAENEAGFIYIYGAQAEVGSYATSAIFTSGSAVTRLADTCSQTVPDGVIGQTEGVLYAELGSIPSEAIDDVFVELSDGTSNNRILFYADSNGYIRNQIKASGSISSLINTNVTVSSNMKIAITYKSNEAKVFINGVQYGGTDTSVVVPSVNKMNLESYTGTRGETSTLKDVKLYNTALTDQELIALTQV